MYRKNRTISSIAVLVSILVLAAAPVWAGSTRLTAETGYQAQDYTMDNPDNRNYSSGLDVIYARMATFAAGADEHNTRGYLKCEDVGAYGANGIRVQLYGYTGEYKTTVASSTEAYIYSQSVKFNPSVADPNVGEVWYSKTGGTNDTFYKITADFNTMSFGAPSTVINVVAAWEVEWIPSGAAYKAGEAFVAGKDVDYNSPHAIYWLNGGSKVKVMEIPKDPASYSCGFAFDNDGNLWAGSYTSSGPASQQYIYRWSNAKVEAAAGGGTLCTPATADVTIACPTFTDGTNTYYTAVSDIECDADANGFVYFSLNGGFDEVENTEAGYIMNVDQSIASSATPYGSGVLSTIAKTNPTSDWDWQKALAYDGAANIDGGGYYNPETGTGGNRLYVHQDYTWGTGDPDTVTGLAKNDDFDGDGVPDSLDNAPEEANGDVEDPAYQVDADLDMYGNIADADFDNNGTVTWADFNMMKSVWSGSDDVIDMDSDGSISYGDFNLLKGRWSNSAPYY
jgi:hypothetical protein